MISESIRVLSNGIINRVSVAVPRPKHDRPSIFWISFVRYLSKLSGNHKIVVEIGSMILKYGYTLYMHNYNGWNI